MITQKLQRNGNSFIVTVSREEIERLQLREGDTDTVEVRKVEVSMRPVLAADLREPLDEVLARSKDALRYLAEH